MRKRSAAWLIAIVVILVIPLTTAYVREYRAIDACEKAGGSYHYKLKVCDMVAKHPQVPFGARHMGLMGLTMMVLMSLAIAKYVKWRRRLGGGSEQ